MYYCYDTIQSAVEMFKICPKKNFDILHLKMCVSVCKHIILQIIKKLTQHKKTQIVNNKTSKYFMRMYQSF